MSAVRKLVIASALVATGLGVAFLLGKPGAIQSVLLPAVSPASKPEPVFATSTTAPNVETALSQVHAQLLPEPANLPKSVDSVLEAPSLISSLVPVAAPNDEPAARDTTFATAIDSSYSPRSFENGTPTARLRNEVPRALGNEPRSVAVIRRLPPLDNVSSVDEPNNPGRANMAGADTSLQQTAPTSFAVDSNAAPATVASFNSPFAGGQQGAIGPPPWPVPDEAREPRTHVVVDGDSLEKLAGRYLDDPQRGRDIYELNRDLLANPDLLPIGAELRIPERVARSSWNRQGLRPAPDDNTTIRSAANGNLVPIRSTTATDPYEVAAPRAQLTRPIAVESSQVPSG